jgi:hypothetical protein
LESISSFTSSPSFIKLRGFATAVSKTMPSMCSEMWSLRHIFMKFYSITQICAYAAIKIITSV